jgi:hypothetical protein
MSLLAASSPTKVLLHRIPVERSAQLDGEVRQMADGRDPMSDVDGEIRVLAALHALQEVVMLTGGIGVQVEFFGPDLRFEDLG